MPWVYSVGSGTPPSYTWFGVNNKNQSASPVTFPSSCAVTQLRVYASGYYASVSTRLALWNSGGSVKVQSSTFTMSSGSASVGGQAWQTRDVSSTVLSAGTYWVGLYRNPSTGHIMGTTASGTTGYVKTNTASFPSISTMSGYTSDDKRMYVGAFYITAPSKPTNVSVTRNSDTSQTISWTRNATSDQPYDWVYLYRYDVISGSWYKIATFYTDYTTSGSNSYTDTTTSANNFYGYKLEAFNDAGGSGYSSTSGTAHTINTTPAKPTSVIATRVSGNVEITWSNPARNEDSLTIQRKTSTDGISWTSYSTLSSSIATNSTSYTDTSPANYNKYQVRADTIDPNVLHSDYVESNEVVILQPPNPPTGLNPDGNEVLDASNVIRLSWQHNAVDSSDQTKFTIYYRQVGGSWATLIADEVSTNEYYDVSASFFTNGVDYEWEVRTWGDATTGGSYSNGSSDFSYVASFKCTSIPVANITSPNGVDDYSYSELTVSWSYTQAESNNQTQYLCKLYENGFLLESKSISSIVSSGNSDSCTFDYALDNESTYYVTLQVKESDGLWSEDVDVTFDTSFLQPTKPTIELASNEDDASVNVTITNPSHATTNTENSIQDTYITEIAPTTNYNTNGYLIVRNTSGSIKTTLLEFDLSAYSGKNITNATLKLYRKTSLSSTGITSAVNYIKTSFDEYTVTWNTTPTIDSTDYGNHAHTDGDSEEWTITDLIHDICNGTITDYEGLAIVATNVGYTEDIFDDSTLNSPELIIEYEDYVELDYNNLYRSIDNGDFELIKTNIPANTIVKDYTPSIGGNNNYYVQAVSVAPSINTSDESDIDFLLTGYYYINAGSGFESYVGFIGNNEIKEDYNKDIVFNRYEGRVYPVKSEGNQLFNTITFSSEILNEYIDDVKILIESTGDKIFRDYDGRWFNCEITGASFKKVSNTSYQFSCLITRLEAE